MLYKTMEKKQSSIEYLVSEIENIGFSVNNTLEFYDIVQIAREMHKEEVQDAYRISPNNELWSNSGIDYYNEAFGVTMSNKKQSSVEQVFSHIKASRNDIQYWNDSMLWDKADHCEVVVFEVPINKPLN